ncbi:Protein MAM3 [Grifola frondosa]|uniref:Protein MAM3 n=1 Tax=Grifola frondosa TaxID=5627 RepID=A0A1C7MQE1_GRIFR|nr:Protein MAM3 [Grifola frondosa]
MVNLTLTSRAKTCGDDHVTIVARRGRFPTPLIDDRPGEFATPMFLFIISSLFHSAHAFPTPSHFTFLNAGRAGEPHGSPDFWSKLIISIGLVLAGGVFAGLTLGLMGLDELHLRVLSASSDDPQERKNAQKGKFISHPYEPILSEHNVLLLGNVIVNESLPIFLDSALGGGLAAVAISTAMIVIFGIIPQAASVRYGLSIGASCAPIVLAMMYLFVAPIAWPIAKLLDYVLGADEAHTYKKAELKSFLAFHRQGEEPLRDDEISILNGVLELNNKKVEKIMTPMADVLTISSDRVLDHDTVDLISRSGYSRIPVHEPGRPLDFVGLLLIKKLSVYDPSKALPVSSFPLSILPEACPSINCFQALDYFQTGRAHLLLLSLTPGKEGGAIGVITLEDIIEEIISEEIVDETDRYEDNQSKRRARRMKDATVMRGIVENIGRANSQSTLPGVTDRTPLISRVASPFPNIEVDSGSTIQSGNGTDIADPDELRGALNPNGNSHPQYGSVIVGSPNRLA